MVTADDVLAFWLGPEWPRGPVPEEVRTRWWKKDSAFDEEIRRQFGETLAQARAGDLEGWSETPRGCLALVIVLDQFSRNIYRDDPRAWEADEKAQRLCRELIDSGKDVGLPPHGRLFLYMPLMHAEDRDLQALSVQKLDALARAYPEMSENLRYAGLHKDIIDRFGRFPHRNEVLGRPSTPEEEAFLEQPGSRF